MQWEHHPLGKLPLSFLHDSDLDLILHPAPLPLRAGAICEDPLHRTQRLAVDGAHDVFATSHQIVHAAEDLVPDRDS